MASYIIRKLDELDWPAIKAKAALEQQPIDKVIKRLLRDWLSDEHMRSLRLACEFGVRQAEKGHNLQMALHQFEETLCVKR